MNLYAVEIGYGLWVVRADGEAEAVRIALDGDEGAAHYGHGPDDVGDVRSLDVDGPAAIMGWHYG